MQAGEGLSPEQIRAFLEASDGVGFEGWNREEVYSWVNQTLRQQGYQDLKRSGSGLVRSYLETMTGRSRAQTTRLISVYLSGDEVKAKRYRFRQRYTGRMSLCWPRGYGSRDANMYYRRAGQLISATIDEDSKNFTPQGWVGLQMHVGPLQS